MVPKTFVLIVRWWTVISRYHSVAVLARNTAARPIVSVHQSRKRTLCAHLKAPAAHMMVTLLPSRQSVAMIGVSRTCPGEGPVRLLPR